MNWILLALAFLLAFFPTLYFMPRLISLIKKDGKFLGPDMNKIGRPLVPSLGGIGVVVGFIFSVSAIVLLSIFFGSLSIDLNLLLFAMVCIILVAFVGLVDDVIAIPRRFTKPILMALASVPMVALSGLDTAIYFPLLGAVDLGIMYNLLFIPLAIIFCTNALNILEGYNGLSSGTGMVIAIGLLAISLVNGSFTGALLMAAFLAVLLVFFHYNRFPAKIFPGNIGTLFTGATIAVTAIITKTEFALFIIMIPFFTHFFLYSRNFYSFKPDMWGIPQNDGSLKCPYKKAYGLMHLLLRHWKKMTEQKVVAYIMLFEAVFVLAAVLVEFAWP